MLRGAIAYTYPGYAASAAVAGGEGWIRTALIAIALFALATFLPRLVARLRGKPMLGVDELKAGADSNRGLILDVRSGEEFTGEQGYITGALNVPLEELEARLRSCWRAAASPMHAWSAAV